MSKYRRGVWLSPDALQKIQKARIKDDDFLSLEQIAFDSGLSYSAVHKALSPGRVDKTTLNRIGKALGVSLTGEDFISNKKPPAKSQGSQSTNKTLMNDDYDLLISSAERLEQDAQQIHDEAEREKILQKAKELRERAEQLKE